MSRLFSASASSGPSAHTGVGREAGRWWRRSIGALDGSSGASSPVSYREAIEATHELLRRRAVQFRALTLTSLVLLLASAGAGLALSWLPAAIGALCLFPVCGLAVLRDETLVGTWRRMMLGAWTERWIDMAALMAALRANKTLPMDTLDGMLATLPTIGDLPSERRIAGSTRAAIAAAVVGIRNARQDALTVRVVVSAATIGLIAGIAASIPWLSAAAVCCGAAAVPARALAAGHRLRSVGAAMERAAQGAAFDEDAVIAFTRTVDWRPLSATRAAAILAQALSRSRCH